MAQDPQRWTGRFGRREIALPKYLAGYNLAPLFSISGRATLRRQVQKRALAAIVLRREARLRFWAAGCTYSHSFPNARERNAQNAPRYS